MPDIPDPSPWLLDSGAGPSQLNGLYWVWSKRCNASRIAGWSSALSKWYCIATLDGIPDVSHYQPCPRPEPPTTGHPR